MKNILMNWLSAVRFLYLRRKMQSGMLVDLSYIPSKRAKQLSQSVASSRSLLRVMLLKPAQERTNAIDRSELTRI